MAKCPQCGRDVSEGSRCNACGMEIQYKDFRGSELLDIKIPPSASHSEEAEKKSMAAKKIDGRVLNPPPTERPRLNKIVFFSFAGIAIILAAVSWYFLLKFLLKF